MTDAEKKLRQLTCLSAEAASALDAALAAARAAGFAASREMAANIAEESTGLLATAARRRLANLIRAMQDAPALSSTMSTLCQCGVSRANHDNSGKRWSMTYSEGVVRLCDGFTPAT